MTLTALCARLRGCRAGGPAQRPHLIDHTAGSTGLACVSRQGGGRRWSALIGRRFLSAAQGRHDLRDRHGHRWRARAPFGHPTCTSTSLCAPGTAGAWTTPCWTASDRVSRAGLVGEWMMDDGRVAVHHLRRQAVYARVTFVQINPEDLEGAVRDFDESVIPPRARRRASKARCCSYATTAPQWP